MTEAEQQILEYKEQNPKASLRQIGKETGFSQRTSYSFHWFNNGYESFEGFLEDLTSRQRKNIKKEREKVLKQSISLEKLDGGSISEGMWNKFYEFYQGNTKEIQRECQGKAKELLRKYKGGTKVM